MRADFVVPDGRPAHVPCATTRPSIVACVRVAGAFLKRHAKFVLGALVHPAQARRWRRFVRDHAVLRDLAGRYPHLLHKIHRPYLSNGIACAGRVDILIGHYRHLFQAGYRDFLQHAANVPVRVATFAGRQGTVFHLMLCAVGECHREGELTLMLMHGDRCLYRAGVVIVSDGGERALALGVLQGLRADDGAAAIRVATRALHGCRPKTLMIAAVRALGVKLGAGRLLLIGNRNRIAVNRRRAGRISADYDASWAELGALARPDGNFELPCAEPALDLDQIPSRKRAQARRRHALTAAIGASVAASLAWHRQQGNSGSEHILDQCPETKRTSRFLSSPIHLSRNSFCFRRKFSLKILRRNVL